VATSQSPFAVLGVSPGASREAIENAYRRLIKLHHPDRPGGDPVRAAEINHAFATLRGGEGLAGPVQVEGPAMPLPVRRRGWRTAVAIGAVTGALLLAPVKLPRPPSDWSAWTEATFPPLPGAQTPVAAARPLAMPHDDIDLLPGLGSGPDEAAVEAGASEALQRARRGDAVGAERFSRGCHWDLRRFPSLALLDHCVAFDSAGAMLRVAGDQFSSSEIDKRASDAVNAVYGDVVVGQARVAAVRRATRNALVILTAAPDREDAKVRQKP
jgi:hypothetical protein